MDDASAVDESLSKWNKDQLFTYNDYNAADLKAINLSREEFALIGENLIMRLFAGRKIKGAGAH
jgi:hypothetical protein